MKKRSTLHLVFVLSVMFLSVSFSVLVAAPTKNAAAAGNQQDNIETCKNCHAQEATPWSTSKHSTGNVNCLVCHKLAPGQEAHPTTKYTVEPEDQTCQVCHTNVAGLNITGQLKLSQHGKVGLKCTSCHEPHSQGPVLAPGSKIVCENCHKIQMQDSLKSTHTAAGANCINCHMGPESSHTLIVAGQTCQNCHKNLHSANRIVTSGLLVQAVATPMDVVTKAAEPVEVAAAPDAGGIHLPSWTLVLAGLLIGGIGSWALFGKDPGAPVK
jgi:hypothetical protein